MIPGRLAPGRTRTAASVLVIAVLTGGCAAIPTPGQGGRHPARSEQREAPERTAPVATPSVAPYSITAPERTPSTATLPTTGAGITTFADPLGLYSSVCTLGFFARYPQGQIVAFTAGHCAEAAKAVRPTVRPVARYLSPDGGAVPFGEFIKSTRRALGQDIAIVQVAGDSVAPVAWSIGSVTGYSTADQLRAGRPEICVVGARTGRHCGALVKVDDRRVTWAGIPAVEGDSGGPVYARWPDGSFTAVGVINTVATREDGTGTGRGTGTLVADDIAVNRMTLLGTG